MVSTSITEWAAGRPLAGAVRSVMADLLRRVADEADPAAFRELYQTYGPRVKAYMMRQGADAALAEDLAQETLLTVWRRASLYVDERGSVATWIFTIARNLRIDRLRREMPWQALPDGGPMPLLKEGSTGAVVHSLQTVLSNGAGQWGTGPRGSSRLVRWLASGQVQGAPKRACGWSAAQARYLLWAADGAVCNRAFNDGHQLEHTARLLDVNAAEHGPVGRFTIAIDDERYVALTHAFADRRGIAVTQRVIQNGGRQLVVFDANNRLLESTSPNDECTLVFKS
jgi:hypothetical protein